MMERKFGVGTIIGIISLVLIFLESTGAINISWWIILAPMIAYWVIRLIAFIVIKILKALGQL